MIGGRLGTEIFPPGDTGQFHVRLRAPDAPRIERAQELAKEAVAVIGEEVGGDNVAITLGYVGLLPSTYPINNIYLWTRGPEEAVLRVALKQSSGVRVEELKSRLREVLPERLGD